MRVQVELERHKGAYRPQHGLKEMGTGDLHLTYRTAGNRRVAVLKLIAADRQWPNLFDPRLVDLSANRMRFIGYERDDQAWHLQEWLCEIVP